ncbi:MAG: PhoX family phosphatase [Proteobacteria bacterium]|nr:PhoX family phosphatase [Burkholderiales bacterium]
MSFADDDTSSNPSNNPHLDNLGDVKFTRRELLTALAGAAATLPFAGCATTSGTRWLGPERLGFTSITPMTEDSVRVPQGYRAQVMYPWGDPTGSALGAPPFRQDGSNSAADQALQSGMHHDAIEYYPLPLGSTSSERGLLAINHEYTDDGLLHADGMRTWTPEKVAKSQNAHGVSIIEVTSQGEQWTVVNPSRFARRITAQTPMTISGPAAGAAAMRTSYDSAGTLARGTVNNCAGGITPWGTYLTCEENWNNYFAASDGKIPERLRRYGVSAKSGYRWHEHDGRFDVSKEPNEANRFGWIVEIDPYEPASRPVKRTALGRFKHEGAMLAIGPDRRLAFYLGDDEVFEYVYKFVTRDAYSDDRAANRNLLDNGTLYVARFNADGGGEWLPLVHGQSGLTKENGFADQADILVRTREAADRAGATKMDRPEWGAVHPTTLEVYMTMTNNSLRGAANRPGVDAANPRAGNVFGHIIRWREQGRDPKATRFEWDIFAQAGDPESSDANKRGNIKGDWYGSPDGLWFDPSGYLWIQTDVSTNALNRGDYKSMGNNMMAVANVVTGETKRFLTGPNGCEVTGCVMTPDGRTMFINIQHPGEPAGDRSDPDKPKAFGQWPDGPSGGRPRSATVAIRKADGGRIGT